MQIDRIYYPVTTLGYGKRIGIWTIGCSHRCYNCSNPELWDLDSSRDVSVDKLLEYIKAVPNADGVTITGGDPFEQESDLFELVCGIQKLGYEDILVYSGYTYEELKNKGPVCCDILSKIGVLIDGRYVDKLNDNMSFRGSSNQRIIVLNSHLKGRYKNAKNWERKTQLLINENKIQAIGLPLKQK